MGRPVLEVADIFRDHGPAWRKANAGHVSLGQLKVMSAIESCRTAALGADRAMYVRLIRISHWTPEDIQREKNYAIEAKDIQPDFICEHSLEELVAFVADEDALHAAGHERHFQNIF